MYLKLQQRNVLAALLIVFVVVAGAVFIARVFREPEIIQIKEEPIHLEFWNVFEDEEIYAEFIKDFTNEYPHVTIQYKDIDQREYRKNLVQAFADGNPPDMFALHNSWLPMFEDKLTPAPESSFFAQNFSKIFPSVVEFDFMRTNEDDELLVYAVPLALETLGLFYNKDLLAAKGIHSPPATWEEIQQYTPRLTAQDSSGRFRTSSIILGSALNINASSDILTLLMMQKGTPMNNTDLTEATFHKPILAADNRTIESFPGKEALELYMAFSHPTSSLYSWNKDLIYSIDAFVEGRAAMMINYPHHIPTVRSKAAYLNFDVAKMPQFRDQEQEINYAYYFGFAVADTQDTKAREAAWQFIEFLNRPNNIKKYLAKTQLPTARLDFILWQEQDQMLKHFAGQIPSARSWHQGDVFVSENTLKEMIESVETGTKTPEEALNDAAEIITKAITDVRKQGLTAPPGPDHSLR